MSFQPRTTPKAEAPLPTTDKYGNEVKVKKIVSKKKRRPTHGDNTMSPFERFAGSNGTGNRFKSL